MVFTICAKPTHHCSQYLWLQSQMPLSLNPINSHLRHDGKGTGNPLQTFTACFFQCTAPRNRECRDWMSVFGSEDALELGTFCLEPAKCGRSGIPAMTAGWDPYRYTRPNKLPHSDHPQSCFSWCHPHSKVETWAMEGPVGCVGDQPKASWWIWWHCRFWMRQSLPCGWDAIRCEGSRLKKKKNRLYDIKEASSVLCTPFCSYLLKTGMSRISILSTFPLFTYI